MQRVLVPLCFHINSSDKAFALKNGKNVVAIHTFSRRYENFNPVVETEKAQRSAPITQCRVKRT